MKKHLFCIAALLISSHFFSQVGINTPTPTKMLDVNGEMRIRVLPDGLLKIINFKISKTNILYSRYLLLAMLTENII